MTGQGPLPTPPAGCSDPGRWTDAYLIAEAHRAEKGVCACGRPLPCIAAERAAQIMAETMAAARVAEEWAQVADQQRAFSRAITQELPVLRDVPASAPVPVGARFYRPRRGDDEPSPTPAAPSTEVVVPAPAASAAPTGARFYRERKPPRHRS